MHTSIAAGEHLGRSALSGDTARAPSPDAIVVLGCPLLMGGLLGAAAERRTQRAAAAFHSAMETAGGTPPFVIVSGGRRWHGEPEADAIARRLVLLGVPRSRILRELCSLSTLENAAYSAEMLREIGSVTPAIVTCDWHVPRALACFTWMGIAATALPAPSPRRPIAIARARDIRERVRQIFDGCAARAWAPS